MANIIERGKKFIASRTIVESDESYDQRVQEQLKANERALDSHKFVVERLMILEPGLRVELRRIDAIERLLFDNFVPSVHVPKRRWFNLGRLNLRIRPLRTAGLD